MTNGVCPVCGESLASGGVVTISGKHTCEACGTKSGDNGLTW